MRKRQSLKGRNTMPFAAIGPLCSISQRGKFALFYGQEKEQRKEWRVADLGPIVIVMARDACGRNVYSRKPVILRAKRCPYRNRATLHTWTAKTAG